MILHDVSASPRGGIRLNYPPIFTGDVFLRSMGAVRCF